ncbi:hypothetical protein FSP39_010005 [Pinctada imbricata]|uniref:Tetraspanin n=1 Tax=Pinctada imbricata TaxID=66713 RepID=A0AA89C5P9_PINIB|nr:hypothetical protein FSP39_010005 [Pinctada imbricata]
MAVILNLNNAIRQKTVKVMSKNEPKDIEVPNMYNDDIPVYSTKSIIQKPKAYKIRRKQEPKQTNKQTRVGGLFGILFLVVGAVVRWGSDYMNSLLSDAYARLSTALKEAGAESDALSDFHIGEFVGDAAIAFVVIGAFFFLLGILGCVGACCKVKCMLVLYVIFLVLIVLAELTFLILVFAFRDEVDSWFKDPLRSAIEKEYKSSASEDSISLAINFVQSEFKCCGVDSYQDFNMSTSWNRTFVYNGTVYEKLIPNVCCKNSSSNANLDCLLSPTTDNAYTDTGCYKAIEDWISDNYRILAGVGGAVLGIEVCVFCIIS